MKNLNCNIIKDGFKLLGLGSDSKIKRLRDISELEKLSHTVSDQKIEWPNTLNNTEIIKDNAKLEPNS
jgi:hypothetical protein